MMCAAARASALLRKSRSSKQLVSSAANYHDVRCCEGKSHVIKLLTSAANCHESVCAEQCANPTPSSSESRLPLTATVCAAARTCALLHKSRASKHQVSRQSPSLDIGRHMLCC